ncbi:unnamed protein product [Arabis nemorensis]|uniref:Uncharacterized protein n=1 Tax=Arabis nemorensis TaxID=586526 RepID=A0A565BIT6_9BRAS|nr:unnamed protein product [Arabis nemorensis]
MCGNKSHHMVQHWNLSFLIQCQSNCDHNYKISFFQLTTVEECDQLPVTLIGWRFANYDDITNGKLGIKYLVDVIGQIVNVTNIQTFANIVKKLTVLLRNSENKRLSCTLFGSYDETLNDYVKNQNNTNVIFVAQFCRTSHWKEVWSVSNAFNCSKVFLNSPHGEVVEFRASFVLSTYCLLLMVLSFLFQGGDSVNHEPLLISH